MPTPTRGADSASKTIEQSKAQEAGHVKSAEVAVDQKILQGTQEALRKIFTKITETLRGYDFNFVLTAKVAESRNPDMKRLVQKEPFETYYQLLESMIQVTTHDIGGPQNNYGFPESKFPNILNKILDAELANPQTPGERFLKAARIKDPKAVNNIIAKAFFWSLRYDAPLSANTAENIHSHLVNKPLKYRQLINIAHNTAPIPIEQDKAKQARSSEYPKKASIAKSTEFFSIVLEELEKNERLLQLIEEIQIGLKNGEIKKGAINRKYIPLVSEATKIIKTTLLRYSLNFNLTCNNCPKIFSIDPSISIETPNRILSNLLAEYKPVGKNHYRFNRAKAAADIAKNMHKTAFERKPEMYKEAFKMDSPNKATEAASRGVNTLRERTYKQGGAADRATDAAKEQKKAQTSPTETKEAKAKEKVEERKAKGTEAAKEKK